MFRVHLTVSFRSVYNERNCTPKPCRFTPRQKGVTSLAGRKKVWTLLLRLFGAALSMILLALLAASLILARPQDEKTETAAALPSSVSRPAVSADQESDLFQLVSDFPAPVMSFMSGSGMTFVSAVSSDAAVSGGEPMVLRSIWPADALTLLESDYHFTPYAGPTLFGSVSVRMENNDSVRLHMTTDQAIYAVYLPRSLSGQINTLCRSLQLFTASPQD